MKHSTLVTIVLIILFLLSHIVGLLIIKQYLNDEKNLPLGIEKPKLNENTSYIPIFLIIIFATLIALFLIKFNALRIWKLWYFLSIFITLVISFAAFTPEIVALIMALLFAFLKMFKTNTIIHNFTEVFIYGGLAAIFVPVLGITSAIILLLLISVYDAFAVWKTKHMISLAEFQTKTKLFAGLLVPYIDRRNIKINKIQKKSVKSKIERTDAILGGGDIAFPLMFSGVMLKVFGFQAALITSFTSAAALFLLFYIAEKKKFYPAMPFITTGTLLGYLIVLFLYL